MPTRPPRDGEPAAGRPESDPFEERDSPEPEPLELEVGDVLDLHSFPPGEVKTLVTDWLDLAHAAGLRELRIIHGRGIGAQRKMVRTILERDPRVIRYADAPGGAGGWGATVVEMR